MTGSVRCMTALPRRRSLSRVAALGFALALSVLVVLPLPSGAAQFTLYATSVESTADWTDESFAVGSPGGCNSTGCCAINDLRTSADFMEARSFGTFSLPVGEHVSQVFVDVFTRYNSSTTGCRVRLRVRHGVPDTAVDSPTWSEGGSGSCRWAMGGSGWDITSLLPAWTAADVNGLWLSVRRYPTNATSNTCRVNGFRIIVVTAPDPPVCSVSPVNLDFGVRPVGSLSGQQWFTITNTGYGTLSVNVESQWPVFFPVLTNGGRHDLGHNESRQVGVSYFAGSPGPASTTITTGCATNVSVQGIGVALGACCTPSACVQMSQSECEASGSPYGGDGSSCSFCPACALSSPELEFGNVAVGSTRLMPVSLTNTGGSTLTGFLENPHEAAFQFVGSAEYWIPSGGSEQFFVAFQPGAETYYDDWISTGCPDGATVLHLHGLGEANGCVVDKPVLSFGDVPEGSFADRSVTLRNGGSGWTSGSLSTTCGRYTILGNTSVDLAPGAEQVVTVRFTAGTAGTPTGELVFDLSSGVQTLKTLLIGTQVPVSGIGPGAAASISRTELLSCTPNPFRGSTSVAFTLAHACPVRVAVLDVAGRRIRRLVDSDLPRGSHQAHWDGTDDDGAPVAAGIYFVRFSAGDVRGTDRVLRVR